jgi:hypothetical protein
MLTTARSRSLVALASATIALSLPLAFHVTPGLAAGSGNTAASAMFDASSRLGHACASAPGYGWPVKPFHRLHAVRGSFGDPRVGLAPSGVGLTYSFHTGVDVVADDGTPVYATLSGRVDLDPTNADAVWISNGNGTTFSYWHVVPAVTTGEHVTAYQTIVGHVQRPWGHVHFSEIHDGAFENPLRPGAMGPYLDHTAPEVTAVTLEHHAHPVRVNAAHGSLDVIAEVDDPAASPIAPPWDGLAVMPAEIRWRIVGAHGAGTRWATAFDVTRTIPSDADYNRVYAQWTRQNHPGKAGRYRVYLSRALSTRELPDGLYHVEVEASDVCGNRTTARASLSVENGSSL